MKQYNKKNREKMALQMKQYNKKNREKKALYDKLYNEQNREKMALQKKQYNKKNREKILFYKKQYNEKNREKISLYKKQYNEQKKQEKLKGKKMHKKLIIIAIVTPLVLISVVAGSVYFSSECKYNPFTGTFVVDGKEYAHGTMKDAWACALEGGLPQSVISRLGK
jgi:phage-related minor tail protein|tara:strand:- start:110 stop:607 length:498 start_codon:yes stop_codon:yes gene_type:complete